VAGDDLTDRTVGNDAAMIDDDQTVGQVGYFGQEMAGDEDGAAVGGVPLEEVAEPAQALGVEAVHGLVEHECPWPTEERGGKAEALVQAEGVCANAPVGGLRPRSEV
jgi:hypothetical protein